MIKFFKTVFFLLLFVYNAKATHIVGGEIYYTYLGGNSYEIKLLVYRDCFNGQAPFDNPASIGFFDSNFNLVTDVFVNITTQGNIANTITSPCLTPPSNVCYEFAEYNTVVSLNIPSGGLQVVYQRCCRNNSIINLVQQQGATYTTTIPDVAVVPVNSSPQFNLLPSTFICQNAPFRFDHAATDAEGDSLVYELCAPFDGASSFSPQPQPPDPPPYNTIVFQPPYSFLDPLGGVPMAIDPITGELTATPANLGQFVYGIRVKEYRNGVLIGESIRDFQVNVVPCPNITVASIFSPTIVCGSLTAAFVNNSFNAAGFQWWFGDPLATDDTSSLMNPNYTYPDTGIYFATLIAYSPINPNCTDTAIGEIRVFPPFTTSFVTNNTRCSPDFNFTDFSAGINGPANYWLWSFGDGAISNLQNPTHTYLNSGNYFVTLIASTDSGCTDTLTMPIDILPNPQSFFNITVDTCNFAISTTNASVAATSYSWQFGDGSSSSAATPNHTYVDPGFYNISLITINDSLCTDTASLLLNLPPLPVALFTPLYNNCDREVTLLNNSLFQNNSVYSYGDGAIGTDSLHTYANEGSYTILLTTNAGSCIDTLSQTITLDPVPIAAFNRNFECDLEADFFETSSNDDFYSWSFGDGSSASTSNPVHTYSQPGTYTVFLEVSNVHGCIDTTSTLVNIQPNANASFQPVISPCNLSVNFIDQSTNAFTYVWNFDDGTLAATSNLNHLFDTTGNYQVFLIVNPGVCADTTSQWIRVSENPVAAARWIPNCSLEASFENLSIGNLYNTWTFGDGNTASDRAPSHTYPRDTTYSVQLIVENIDGCMDSINFQVTVDVPSLALFDASTDSCEATLTLNNRSSNAEYYLWDFGDGNSDTRTNINKYTYNTTGLYDVILYTNPGSLCADTASQRIYAQGSEFPLLYKPTAFTPDGDGLNDYFQIYGYNQCAYNSITILNRWGEVVFSSNNLALPWDGSYKGMPAPEGLYVYILASIGKEFTGSVLLLR